jgi:hypothetical protein
MWSGSLLASAVNIETWQTLHLYKPPSMHGNAGAHPSACLREPTHTRAQTCPEGAHSDESNMRARTHAMRQRCAHTQTHPNNNDTRTRLRAQPHNLHRARAKTQACTHNHTRLNTRTHPRTRCPQRSRTHTAGKAHAATHTSALARICRRLHARFHPHHTHTYLHNKHISATHQVACYQALLLLYAYLLPKCSGHWRCRDSKLAKAVCSMVKTPISAAST